MNLAGQRTPFLNAVDLFGEQPHALILLLFYDSSPRLLLLASSSVVNQWAARNSRGSFVLPRKPTGRLWRGSELIGWKMNSGQTAVRWRLARRMGWISEAKIWATQLKKKKPNESGREKRQSAKSFAAGAEKWGQTHSSCGANSGVSHHCSQEQGRLEGGGGVVRAKPCIPLGGVLRNFEVWCSHEVVLRAYRYRGVSQKTTVT